MNRQSAITAVSALLCSGLVLSGTAFAQLGQFGTPVEARAMFDKAIAAVKADKARALDMFNKGEGGFRDRDLYVFCFDDKTGVFNAHVVKSLLGTDVRAVKEKDGSPLGQKIFDAVKEGTVATVSYNFPRPGSNDPVPKESFVTAVGTQACGVGYYK
jgi:signal transduction histidine kinase